MRSKFPYRHEYEAEIRRLKLVSVTGWAVALGVTILWLLTLLAVNN